MTLLMTNQIDVLFRSSGEVWENPITGGRFVKDRSGEDSLAYQKRDARKALFAREYFALHGPPGAPPLPLTQNDWDDMRRNSGLTVLVGFFARSLNFRDWQVYKHPPFEDFARGLMAIPDTGLWDLRGRLGQEPRVIKKYSPCPLPGMTPGLYWAPPKEYEQIMAEYAARAGKV